MRALGSSVLFVGYSAIFGLLFFSGCGKTNEEPLPCLDRAVYGEPAESAYVLPFPVGESYRVSQGCCYPHGGHRNKLSYDFEMPIGATVIAARGGLVRQVRSDLPDNGEASGPGEHNHILIHHDDGTVGFYAHLQQGSIEVTVGARVKAGDHIANSGNSGDTAGLAHLHFGVYQGWPTREGFDVAVNFRNAEGPLNARKGLRAGGTFKAVAY